MIQRALKRIIEYSALVIGLVSLVGCASAGIVNREIVPAALFEEHGVEADEAVAEIEDSVDASVEVDTFKTSTGEVSEKEPVVKLSAEQLLGFATMIRCEFDMESQSLLYELEMPKLPASDDTNVYLIGYECFEEDNALDGTHIIDGREKNNRITFYVPYERRFLFMEFLPAIKLDGELVPLCSGTILSNAEILAPNQSEYPKMNSIKGLLIDPETVGTDALNDLGVKYAVYNIPLSHIMGNPNAEDTRVIEYEYSGKSYYFDERTIKGYDYLFRSFQEAGMCTTAIVLNDWNEMHPELMHPLSRNKTKESHYYAFNTVDEEAVKELEAVALFLAERYSTEEYGLVSGWVIANEINEHQSWNYMDTTDLDYYVREFEKGFRIFYQAIKSRYANAKIYFSIDNKWNEEGQDNAEFFNGKELLAKMNEVIIEKGNYDWSLAIHPYLEPMNRVKFWKGEYDKSEAAQYLTIMNLSTLTKVLEREEYLNPDGNVRDITVTELGFTSKKGEKLQAAAFAYCYYILESNPYISSFMMNRQTDAKEETKFGLAFGIYKKNLKPKYIKDVFRYIDTDQRNEYTMFMLEQIGATSVAEAVSWAQD